MKIVFLIINYNGLEYLKNYLEDISNHCIKNDIKLIVTDDNSTDQSIVLLKSFNIEYTINNSKNHGFAANVNNGIKYANIIDFYDYYIISNNDIKIHDSFFSNLNKILFHIKNINKDIGLIGFDEVLIERKKYFYDFNYDQFEYNLINEVTTIPGFFFIITRPLVEKIGLMDEEYYMYGEDNDYFTRTTNANYMIINTNLPILHFSEGSSNNKKLTSWYVYRNSLLFAQKNLGILMIIKITLSLINQIYNPFFRTSTPSNNRVIRNGFFINNYLLIKSIIWNINYYIKKNKKNDK